MATPLKRISFSTETKQRIGLQASRKAMWICTPQSFQWFFPSNSTTSTSKTAHSQCPSIRSRQRELRCSISCEYLSFLLLRRRLREPTKEIWPVSTFLKVTLWTLASTYWRLFGSARNYSWTRTYWNRSLLRRSLKLSRKEMMMAIVMKAAHHLRKKNLFWPKRLRKKMKMPREDRRRICRMEQRMKKIESRQKWKLKRQKWVRLRKMRLLSTSNHRFLV